MLFTSFRIHRHISSLVIAVGVTTSSLAGSVSLTKAQTINQSYTCGTYGASDYGRNDCVTADGTTPSVMPTPTFSITPTPLSPITPIPSSRPVLTIGGLPITGIQLVWVSLIGLGLVVLDVGLSLRVQRRRSAHP
ncbi:MAG: hypothetical protein ACR2OU_06050 [Thermomicrobiales bacterium]